MDDEFYTPFKTVAEELDHYKFTGKRVFCPCDGPDSAFVKYFERIGVPVTWRKYTPPANLFGESVKDESRDFEVDDEFWEKLNNCDIVVTNPPFSKSRVFFDYVRKSGKKFLFLASYMFGGYKAPFEEIRAGRMWGGYNNNYEIYFFRPGGERRRVVCSWYTNIPHPFPKFRAANGYTCETLKAAGKWKFYDDEEILYLESAKDLPSDYFGAFAVSQCSIYHFCNPKEFEIIGMKKGRVQGEEVFPRVVVKRADSFLPPRDEPLVFDFMY